MRLLLLAAFFSGLCATAAGAQQGGPGWLDPQRVVSNSLSAANAATQMSLATGYSACSAAVSGTFSGTLTFEQSNDGSNWFGAYLTPNSGGSATSTTTSAFFGTITLLGAPWFRVRMSTYTSGTAVATTYCSPAELPFGAIR
jgi:hypothetical protein